MILSFYFPFTCRQTDGNGGPDEVQLDAEMEKVFAVAGPGTRENRHDKFDVAQLIGDAEARERESARFKDYDSDCKCFFVFSIFSFLNFISSGDGGSNFNLFCVSVSRAKLFRLALRESDAGKGSNNE